MAAGRMTARSITQLYLNRIAELDRKGPTLRHVIEVNPDALSSRIRSTRNGKRDGFEGRSRHPILLKDNIGTADKMTTTAGSLALEGVDPAEGRVYCRQTTGRGRDPARQSQSQ
jgi:amidase